MGATYVTVSVGNLAKDASPFEASFLVDTGGVDCRAPRDKLAAAGIQPEGRKVYELADGRTIELEYGFARISFQGSETVAQVIFGPEGVEPLLGVVALENTGTLVDPVSQSLKRLPAIPLKQIR